MGNSEFQKKYRQLLSLMVPGNEIDVLIQLTAAGHPLALYGAGGMSTFVYNACKQQGLRVSCVCDGIKSGVYGSDKIPLVSPSQLRRDFGNAVVFISSAVYEKEIHKGLSALGFPEERIVGFPWKYFFMKSAPCSFERHVGGYEWAYDFFQDERSKQTVVDRMRLYICGDPIAKNTECPIYFEDEFITLGDHDVFVDGGGFIGDTAEEFIRQAGGRYDRVYLFEPNQETCLLAKCTFFRYGKVEVIPKGLWSKECNLVFYQSSVAEGSSFSKPHNVVASPRLPVTSIDAFFANKTEREWPTFIKMDIEGAEKEALLGAADVIRRKRPMLAISAYHNPEDIYELPKVIQNICKGYCFALRQPVYGGFDTILYGTYC